MGFSQQHKTWTFSFGRSTFSHFLKQSAPQFKITCDQKGMDKCDGPLLMFLKVKRPFYNWFVFEVFHPICYDHRWLKFRQYWKSLWRKDSFKNVTNLITILSFRTKTLSVHWCTLSGERTQRKSMNRRPRWEKVCMIFHSEILTLKSFVHPVCGIRSRHKRVIGGGCHTLPALYFSRRNHS